MGLHVEWIGAAEKQQRRTDADALNHANRLV